MLVHDIRGDHELAFGFAYQSLVSNMIITGIPFEIVRETRAPWNCKMAKVGFDKTLGAQLREIISEVAS